LSGKEDAAGVSNLWPEQEARRIVERWPQKETYILQTGFGPSGHPHMGTVGEVVRTYFVGRALQEMGKRFEIIVFADDMDGLRKIPKNIDAPWLEEHLGKPVSSIPDPYGTDASYSGHMNRELHEMLGATGIPYSFRSSERMYKDGHFNEVLRLLFRHAEQILALILPTMREENREGWFFFQPACENCGRVNNTQVLSYDRESCQVTYACTAEFRGVRGCGYEGSRSALDGGGKLGWKVDWAARWYAFGVSYEMYGKDLIESAKLSKEIVRIIGGRPPVDMFYEMFLTEEGRKISKSVGAGLSIENWDRWGTRDSLYLLMFKNPRQQKRLGPDTVIQYTDEVLLMGKEDPQYPYIYFAGDRPDLGGLRFSDIVNLVSAISVTDPDQLLEYLGRSFGHERIRRHEAYVRDLLEKAINYYEDFILPTRHVPELKAEHWQMVDRFAALIERDASADEIQSGVFAIAREHGMEAKDFFRVLYGVLLGAESGPRIGGFVALLGREKVKELIGEARAKQSV
jgi:lysyl-tRNA synthetase, class I